MIFHRTLAVTDKLLRDIEKILYWTTIVVQCIFFAYYGYSIYTNLSNLTFLIIYILLLLFSTVGFIYYLSHYRDKAKENVKTVKKTFRIFKYLVNGSMLVLNMIGIIRYGGNDLAYVLIVFSSLSLIVQIIVELIRDFVSRYITLFSIALDKDTQFIRRLQDVKDYKGNFYGIVDAPLQVIAKKIETENLELSDNEKLVEELSNMRKEKRTYKIKSRHQENTRRQKDEIKEHLNIIKNRVFKRNKVNSKVSNEVQKKE